MSLFLLRQMIHGVLFFMYPLNTPVELWIENCHCSLGCSLVNWLPEGVLRGQARAPESVV